MIFERCNHYTYGHFKLAEALMSMWCGAGILSDYVPITHEMTIKITSRWPLRDAYNYSEEVSASRMRYIAPTRYAAAALARVLRCSSWLKRYLTTSRWPLRDAQWRGVWPSLPGMTFIKFGSWLKRYSTTSRWPLRDASEEVSDHLYQAWRNDDISLLFWVY